MGLRVWDQAGISSDGIIKHFLLFYYIFMKAHYITVYCEYCSIFWTSWEIPGKRNMPQAIMHEISYLEKVNAEFGVIWLQQSMTN